MPHHCSKQFSAFRAYDLASMTWKEHEIPFKQLKGGHEQDFVSFYKKEIELWNAGKLAEAYMTALENSS